MVEVTLHSIETRKRAYRFSRENGCDTQDEANFQNRYFEVF